ncbi:unnamed protein product [Cladocopium goreaui]|uniref:Protein transport Sec1a n=1 Tax=Cladocopium goreaui TaxID=2562237 RepID=A0A9P1CH52_9DINO|nr:unnamed protein product [Cladocopium goreaui]
MHDLLSEGIALVECLDSRREALPLDALYFLAPTMENMDRLVEELSTKPKYRSSHVFFSHRLEDLMLQRVAESYEAVARISSFAELNVSMLCYDDRSFQLQDQGDALKQLLGIAPQGSEEGMDLRQVGSCLATFFASMGQEPLVFCAGNRGCERLAREVCQRLEEMETHGAAWRDTTSSETCSLLIVDRSFDWAPVLVHDMGYEVDFNRSEGAWLSTLPSIGSEAVDAQVNEANLTELEEDALEGAAATEGHAGLPSPDTSPQPRRLGKLPELKCGNPGPHGAQLFGGWVSCNRKVQLSQLGKVRAAEAPKESPVTLKSLAKRVSDASQHSGRGSVSGPPSTAPGAVSASQKTARQGTGLDVPPPIFGLNGHGQNGLSRASAVKDITAGAPRTSKAQAEENDGNFAATYPSALARKMANVLQKLKDQGEDVSMSTALSSRRPKEGAERPPATAPGENWRDPLGESFAEVKLPGFKGAWPAPKSAEAAAPAISELGALPPMEVFFDGRAVAQPAQAGSAPWVPMPSEGIRAGAAPGTGLVELELSARPEMGRFHRIFD